MKPRPIVSIGHWVGEFQQKDFRSFALPDMALPHFQHRDLKIPAPLKTFLSLPEEGSMQTGVSDEHRPQITT
jgi:hypothetical protein